MQLNRRSFISSAAAAGFAPFLPGCLSAGKKTVSGDRVRLACVGIGCQAWNDIRRFAETGLCEFVAFCDTDLGGPQTVDCLKRYPAVPVFKDFRKMLDKMGDKIDAVAVMIPDFSHFPVAMAAMKAGKAVYVEKPLAHTFEECELLMAAERKYGVVTQMGNQGHSGDNYFQFRDYVEKGVIDVSKLTKLVAHMNNPRRWHKWNGRVRKYPDAERIPLTLDWDLWLTTALRHEYSHDYVQGEWRSWFDFGNGCLGDWGAHTMDTMHRFFKLGLPSEVKISNVTGWNPFVFPMQDTLTFRFESCGSRPALDLEWYEGTENLPPLPAGYVRLNGDGNIPKAGGSSADKTGKLMPGKIFYLDDGSVWEGASHSAPIYRIGTPAEDLPDYEKPTHDHYANFLLAVLGREEAHSPFSVTGPLSETFCLGCIAQRLNRSFKFDPVTKTIPDDEVANALLKGVKGTPRAGWEEFYRV